MNRLRIAILTHSTHPRGGVVHALELGDALDALGHHAVVHAPDPLGAGFFRDARCETRALATGAVGAGIAAMVHGYVGDYVRHFETGSNRQFDIFHAQDSISGNALAAMKQCGLIRGFARTVHHIDHLPTGSLPPCSVMPSRRRIPISRSAAFGRTGSPRISAFALISPETASISHVSAPRRSRPASPPART